MSFSRASMLLDNEAYCGYASAFLDNGTCFMITLVYFSTMEVVSLITILRGGELEFTIQAGHKIVAASSSQSNIALRITSSIFGSILEITYFPVP
jgi:hypothetical protein